MELVSYVCVYKTQHVGKTYIISIFTPPEKKRILPINATAEYMLYNVLSCLNMWLKLETSILTDMLAISKQVSLTVQEKQ